MASTLSYRLAKARVNASSAQARLQEEVQRQAVLQANMERSKAKQAMLQAEMAQSQATGNKQVAKENLRLALTEFENQKLTILLDGFRSMSSIYGGIQTTASLLLGFVVTVLTTDISGARAAITLTMWGISCLSIWALLHSIFVSTVTLTDATKLAYQGSKGTRDVQRAFHGLMRRHREVFWHFVCGFGLFLFLFLTLIWAKIDASSDEEYKTVYLIFGITISVVGWAVPVFRMKWAFLRSRKEFRISNEVDEEDDDKVLGFMDIESGINENDDATKPPRLRVDSFEAQLGTQTRRRRILTKISSDEDRALSDLTNNLTKPLLLGESPTTTNLLRANVQRTFDFSPANNIRQRLSPEKKKKKPKKSVSFDDNGMRSSQVIEEYYNLAKTNSPMV